MWLVLFSCFLHCLMALKVFTFNGTSTPAETPSIAYLTKEVDLPNPFILCSSVKQARFDDLGFYSISGKDSRDWMIMFFLSFSNATKLALLWDENFRILDTLTNPRLDYWYHTCAKIDLKTNEFEVAVNGEIMGRLAEKNITNKPNKLDMKIGADFYSIRQFQGSVSNIQVFTEGNLIDLSAFPCKNRQDAILLWNPKHWKVKGSDWSLTEDFEDTFCTVSDNYNLAISSMITFKEGVDICKHKLNNSIIPFQEDRSEFHRYVEWHKNLTRGVCSHIWTPYSDEQSEGTFLNMNSLSKAQPHFWAKDQPNGGTHENFAAIHVSRAALVDIPGNYLSCSSCMISSSLLLQLDGRCRHSLIGILVMKD